MTTTAITAAARWLQETPVADRPAHVVAHLRHEFGLTPAQAVQAINKANASDRTRTQSNAEEGAQ